MSWTVQPCLFQTAIEITMHGGTQCVRWSSNARFAAPTDGPQKKTIRL
jgi:hypothetical protein